MEAKALVYSYFDNTGFTIEQIYLKIDFEQAEKDLKLLKKHCDMKKFELIDTKIYDKFKD